MIRWNEQSAIPKGVAAILSGTEPSTEADWREALDYADRFQLTPQLNVESPRVERARGWTIQRNARILKLAKEILASLPGNYEILILKGFAHENLFHVKQNSRIQYDLDLFSPELAPEILLFIAKIKEYQWKGDYYDLEIPIQIDFHQTLWNERMEGFPAPGIEKFWNRRVWSEFQGLRFQTLAPPDALGFAALHMLKHILHGDARPAHGLEIASFLRHHPEGDEFWGKWREWHSPELRRLEAIAFRFAAEWFGCPAPPEANQFPSAIEEWFARCAASPITSYFRPNKDELALNLLLIDGKLGKARVAARRLFPLQWPKPFSYALSRGAFHLRALPAALAALFRPRR